MILPKNSAASKHLVVDISAHGFGHLVQAAAVLNALDCSNVKLTVRSLASVETLNERIRHPFELVRYQQDNGMIMHDALRVNVQKTIDWYRHFHSTYDDRKSEAARDLDALRPDLVFSNVPYLGLDAAATVGVPSVALCSLNWADIFRSYCGECPDANDIHDQIMNAYSQADLFLQPTPSMPMETLGNTRRISPLAFVGTAGSEVLRSTTGGDEDMKFVLVGVGGVGIKNFPLERWPVLDNVRWIFPDAALEDPACLRRDDFFAQSLFRLDYIDLLSSCSLVLTKTGYGTMTEAVVNQVPALCISRHDWPEHVYLQSWHETHGHVAFLDWEDLGTPKFTALVVEMLSVEWRKCCVAPTGAKEAADIVRSYL